MAQQPYKHLSGSQKRKLQKEREEKAGKLQKIDLFLKKPIDINSPSTSNIDKTVVFSDERIGQSSLTVAEPEICTEYNTETTVISNINEQHEEVKTDAKLQSDMAVFPGPVSVETKEKVLSMEPCRPLGPFPKDPVSKRSFSAEYYSYTTLTGQRVDRYWLCYSPKLDAAYCEPCWLFNTCSESRSWGTGIRDWQGLSKKIKKHECGKSHLNACQAYTMWKKNKTIVDQLSDEHRKWKDIFIRIVDVVRTLAMCSLPFRGHRENVQSIGPESGNFLNIIDLISRYDSLLAAHLTNEKSRNKYLHKDIQNEIIGLLARSVLKTLLCKITSAPFYTLILDSTQDISHRDQLSVIIRYITLTEKSFGESKLEINESFLGFTEICDQSSEGFENTVLKFLDEKGIDIQKCRGQGYDGASTMSGQYSGLQTRIKNITPTADYVHCAAHNLNLVLNDSVSNISEVSQFYDIVQQTYVYFSGSLPRWQSLTKTMEEESLKKKLKLKKVCPTRWASRHDCLLALKNDIQPVIKCLTKIILFSAKKQEVDEAVALRKHIDSFDFILMLILESKILNAINTASQSLQHKSVDLDKARYFLERALKSLQELRTNFSEFLSESTQFAQTCNISTEMKKRRQRIVKRFFDELASDFRIESPVKSFEVKVFNASLDIVINQIRNRFSSLQMVVDSFSFLRPENLSKLPEKEITAKALFLINKYPDDISDQLTEEILSFRSLLADEIAAKKTVRDVAKLLIEDNSFLLSSFPNLATTVQLYLTLPVTTATAERSFSKLKLIKNYLRSTMSQTRLSDLAILSIEQQETREVNIDKIVEEFLILKKRRLSKLQ